MRKQTEAICLWTYKHICDNAEQTSVSPKPVLAAPAGKAAHTSPVLVTVHSHVQINVFLLFISSASHCHVSWSPSTTAGHSCRWI